MTKVKKTVDRYSYSTFINQPNTFFSLNTYGLEYQLFDKNYYRILILASNLLKTSISIYANAIEKSGYTLKLGTDKTDKASKKELLYVNSLITNVNATDSLEQLRYKIRADLEAYGSAFTIIRKNDEGKTDYAEHVPSNRVDIQGFVRELVAVTVNGRSFTQPKVFPIYRVYKDHTWTYYKDFHCSYTLSATTGKIISTTSPVVTKEPVADSMVMLHLEDYGMTLAPPRWAAAIPDIVSAAQISGINRDMLQRGGVPPWIATVSGGSINPDNIRRLDAKLNGDINGSNYNKLVIIEAQGNHNEEIAGPDSSPKIEFKNLRGDNIDAMFAQYAMQCNKAIKNAFCLPDVFYGVLANEPADSIKNAIMATEAAVFQPERKRSDDFINRYILGDGINYNPFWIYESSPLYIADKVDVTTAIKDLAEMGAVTPNDSVRIANKMFQGIELQQTDKPYGQMPHALLKQVIATKASDSGYADLIEFLEGGSPLPDG